MKSKILKFSAGVLWLSVGVAPWISSAQAAYSPFVSCSTSSQGYNFRDADYSVEAARARVLQTCHQHPYASDGECNYKLKCDDDSYRDRWLTCRTTSQGYTFLDGDINREAARQRAIRSCTDHPYASDGQCRANIQCEGDGTDPYAKDYQVCTTNSQGYNFVDADPNREQGRSMTIQACEKHPYTNKGQCRANVKCAGDEYTPGLWAICRTKSQGYNFIDGDYNVRTAMDRLLNTCMQHPYARDPDCRVNVSCEGGYPVNPNPPYNPPGNGGGGYDPAPPSGSANPGYPGYPSNPSNPGNPNTPRIVCFSFSRGQAHRQLGNDEYSTRRQAIGACQADPRSDRRECETSASCRVM